MRITPDNAVVTRNGTYPCINREQAEALLMSLTLRERGHQRQKSAAPGRPQERQSRSS